jgi:hypothetical protein
MQVLEERMELKASAVGFFGIQNKIPSGKHTKNYGKSPFLIGKSTINGPFSIAMLNYQRVQNDANSH